MVLHENDMTAMELGRVSLTDLFVGVFTEVPCRILTWVLGRQAGRSSCYCRTSAIAAATGRTNLVTAHTI